MTARQDVANREGLEHAFRGRRAVVTGASGGIGAAMAEQLAEAGADVVLVARSADRLDALADTIRARYHVSADVVVTDLSTTSGVDSLIEALAGTPVDVLIPNAGVGAHGPFVDEDPERTLRQVMLNCAAVTRLVRAFLPAMLARGTGHILTVASTGAFQPTPWMAVYGASKAFVLSFTEALWEETRGSGVRVLALSPGPTSTGFFEAAGGDDFLLSGRQSPEHVARVGLRALARAGGPSVVPGAMNVVLTSSHRFVTRRFMARMAGRHSA